MRVVLQVQVGQVFKSGLATHLYYVSERQGDYVFACVCLSVCVSVCVSVTKIYQEWMIESLSNFQDKISGSVAQTD